MADPKANQTELDRVNRLRAAIKVVAADVDETRQRGFSYGLGLPTDKEAGEARANVTLAYRHLEDASMRLGKATEALGEVSAG